MISRQNYEIVFIDYFDGRLDKIHEQELFSFLKMNPDLKEEFNLYSGIQTEADLKVNFEGKDKLKKDTITTYNYKTWLVGYTENDLKPEQKKEVETFLSKNPSLKNELEIFKSIRLIADKRIIFNKKNSLKRGAKVIQFTPAVKRVLSIAAALLFFALTYFLIHQLNTPKSFVADQHQNNQIKTDENKLTDSQKPKEENKKANPEKEKLQENHKSNKSLLASHSKINNTPVQIINQREIPNEVSQDSLHAYQLIEKYLKDHPDVTGKVYGQENNNQLASGTIFPAIKLQQTKIPSTRLSEIFTEEDMKELGIDPKKNSDKPKTGAENILNIASTEIKKISMSTDISYEKQEDPLGNSVTYAFEVGRSFSITHTKVQ